MTQKEKLRNSILAKVKVLSEDKLSNLNSYLDELENQFSSEKSSLSFSGAFENLDIAELTTELHKTRKQGNERIENL